MAKFIRFWIIFFLNTSAAFERALMRNIMRLLVMIKRMKEVRDKNKACASVLILFGVSQNSALSPLVLNITVIDPFLTEQCKSDFLIMQMTPLPIIEGTHFWKPRPRNNNR